MREILFRGKRVYNGEWVYGLLTKTTVIPENGMAYIAPCIEIEIEKPFDGGWFEVIPDTVGQYTGLCDKNGKKIFEGDILEHHVQSDIIVCRGEVFWETKNGRWELRLNTMNPCFYMHNPKAVEVIGNIHDNPELLKGEQHDSYYVDVVRCKDCEYWMYEYDDIGLCAVDVPDVDGVERHADDFCSYGERKRR